MVTETLELVIRTTGASPAADEVRRIGSAADTANRQLHGMADTMRLMRNVLVGLSFARAFEGIAEAVNQFQNMQNKLRLVTSSTEEARAAQITLAKAAVETRSNFENTVNVFAGIARSTKALGLDYGQILKLTKEWNQSIVVSGVDQNQARNALKDFIEELNIGVIQGRQLRALLMQNPEFLRLMAEGMAKVGKASDPWFASIKKATEGGKTLSGSALFEINKQHPGSITSLQAIQAVLLGADEEAKKFNTTTTTIGQTFENLKTKATVFFALLAEKSGALKWLQDSMTWIGDHLDIVTELVAAFAGLLVLNVVTGALARFGSTLGGVLSFATISLKNTYEIILGIGSKILWLATLWGGWGAVIIAVGALIISAFWKPLSDAFSGLGQWVQRAGGWFNVLIDVIATVGAVVQTVFDGIKVAFDAVSGWVVQHMGPVLGAIKWILSEVGSLISKVGQAGWAALPDSVKNTLGGAASAVSSDFTSHFKENQSELSSLAARAKSELSGLNLNNITEGLNLKAKPPGSGNEGVLQNQLASATAQQLAQAQSELMSMLGRFGGPSDKYAADVEKMRAAIIKLTTATKTHAAALTEQQVHTAFATAGFNDYNAKTHESESFNNAMMRSVLGLKNTQIDLNNTLAVVTQAEKMHAITVAEGDEIVKKATLSNELYKLSLSKGTPNEAAAGGMAGFLTAQANKESPFDVAEKYAEELKKSGDASSDYAIKVQVLNQAVAAGVITQQKYVESLRDLQIELLKTQTDIGSGLQLGILEADKSMNDLAKTISGTVTQAFEGLTDQLTKFITTGKADFKQLGQEIETGLVKTSVQGLITGPLASGLSSLVPGLGGTLGSATHQQLGASSSNPLYVTFASDGSMVNSLSDGLFGGTNPFGTGSASRAATGGGGGLFGGTGAGSSGGSAGGLFGSLFGTGGTSSSSTSSGGMAGAFGLDKLFNVNTSNGNGLLTAPGTIFGQGGFFSNLFNGTGDASSASQWLLGGGSSGGGNSGLLSDLGMDDLFSGSGNTTPGAGGMANLQGAKTLSQASSALGIGSGGPTLSNGGEATNNGQTNVWMTALNKILSSMNPSSMMGGMMGGGGGGGGASGGGGMSSMFSGLFSSGSSGASTDAMTGISTAASDSSGFLSNIGDLFSFATGGEFTVGGMGGTDSQLVAFRASPDETVSIKTPGQASTKLNGSESHYHVHLHGGDAVDTFNRSPGQTAAAMTSMASRTNMRNGSGQTRGRNAS